MSLNIPAWLNSDFLKKCLQSKDEFKNAVVKTFKVTSGVPPGNNYGSVILRVKLEYEEVDNDNHKHPSSLIVKAPLTEGSFFVELFTDCESEFYYKFIPAAKEFSNVSFVADTFNTPLKKVIVMEDLTDKGYKMVDKSQLLDFKHCQQYMISAAKLHAVSYAVKKHNPEAMPTIPAEKIFTKEKEYSEGWKMLMRHGIECMINRASECQEKKNLVIILKKFEIIWDMLVESNKPGKTLNCLTQGDPWLTNMMFKYDDQEIVDNALLLDFQCLKIASPALDLVFFTWSSCNRYVLENRLDDIYHIYLDKLNETLNDLNCSVGLTYEWLTESVQKASPLALWIAAFAVPLQQYPGHADIEGILSRAKYGYSATENLLDEYYTEDFCKKHLTPLLKLLGKNGVLDYLATNA